ncbi:MAG: YhfC family glutamic-type intramembrane protease [Anaerolineales bacterium]|nr:YhfC family glutamic-type intramembrane protease [Anaerolineales bacterium]
MLAVTYAINFLGMILLPILLGIYLSRRFKLSWRLFLAGALTFIAAQVVHVPVLSGLTALFNAGVLPAPAEAWTRLFNAVVLGLLAGIFEETARYILFKFVLKKTRTWNEGLMVGAGHGGIEAIFLGILAALAFFTMLSLRGVDVAVLQLPADQAAALQQQVTDFWSAPVYLSVLGFVERIFAMAMQITLSVMVLRSVTLKQPLWFWLAILWHALVNGTATHLLPTLGAAGVEVVIAGFAVVSLIILFAMRLAMQPKADEARIAP